jgi:hypothetical protein
MAQQRIPHKLSVIDACHAKKRPRRGPGFAIKHSGSAGGGTVELTDVLRRVCLRCRDYEVARVGRLALEGEPVGLTLIVAVDGPTAIAARGQVIEFAYHVGAKWSN